MLCTYCDAVKTPAALYNFRCPDCGSSHAESAHRPRNAARFHRTCARPMTGVLCATPRARARTTPEARDEHRGSIAPGSTCRISIAGPISTREPTITSIRRSCTTAPSSRKASPPSWARPTVRRTATPSARWAPRCASSAFPGTRARWCAPAPRKARPAFARPQRNIFPYMFEYDVDLLTFFRIVDCGDIPIVPGNNDKSHEYIYRLSDRVPARRRQGRSVRRRSFGADPGRPRALRFSQERAHRLSPRRLPSRRGAGLGGQRLHQLLRSFPRARPAELQRQEHGAYGLAQRAQSEGLVRFLRRQRGAADPDAGACRPAA